MAEGAFPPTALKRHAVSDPDYRAAVLNGTLARTSRGRLTILSEAVTTHASPAGRFGVSIRNAPMLTTHRTVAATAAAMTSEDICSPLMRISLVRESQIIC